MVILRLLLELATSGAVVLTATEAGACGCEFENVPLNRDRGWCRVECDHQGRGGCQYPCLPDHQRYGVAVCDHDDSLEN